LTALAGPIRDVWELVKAGGWPMVPLLLLGVALALAILERFWSLRRKEVLPPGLAEEVRNWAAKGKLNRELQNRCAPTPRWARCSPPLEARQTARPDPRAHRGYRPAPGHGMERFLNALGTIASAARCWACSAP
jgi:biopolymer transport protein ExbB